MLTVVDAWWNMMIMLPRILTELIVKGIQFFLERFVQNQERSRFMNWDKIKKNNGKV